MKTLTPLYFLLMSLVCTGVDVSRAESPSHVATSPDSVEYLTMAREFYSGAIKQENLVITNPKEWKAVWRKVYANMRPRPRLPRIRFQKEMVIGVFAGELPTGGYAIEVIEVTHTAGTLTITVKNSSPGRHCGVTMALTQPVHLVKVKKLEYKEVDFVEVKHVNTCKLR